MYNGVLMARRWLLLAVLVCMTTQVSAQRVFKTIKPDEVDDTLKFDVSELSGFGQGDGLQSQDG
ncbi:MAG: hypothetical protein P8Y94_08250 [Acidobacteriota bacterium]